MMRALVPLVLAAALCGCAQDKTPKAEVTPIPQDPPRTAAPAPAQNWPQVTAPKLDAAKTFQYLKDLSAMGPRPVGAPAHKRMEDYIVAHLGGAQVEDDRFQQKSDKGDYMLRNIVAKFPGTKDGIIVLASHYDTKMIPGFVGANDGGSSTALLLGIADALRANMKNGKREGYAVWLAFCDGEEAFGANINDADGLFGSKHLAQKWQQDGTARKIKALVLADMIGDKELNVLRDANSSPQLLDLIQAAASQLGYQSHFFEQTEQMIDDHVPFKEVGIPVADLIDFDYGYQNAFWHTTEDTLDKLSPKSLAIVGDVMLQSVWMLDKKD